MIRLIRKLVITAAALLVFAAAFVLRESPKESPGPEAEPETATRVEAPLPKLVDLGSDKCVPCKKMAPILAELESEYRGSFEVEFIDVWKDPDAGKPFGIRVIPTQVFLDASGQERFRHEGFYAKEAILAKWKELGVALAAPVPGPGS